MKQKESKEPMFENIHNYGKKDKKDAEMAVFGSMLFPGLGQAYNCDIYKALSFFGIGFVIVVMSLLLIIASIVYPIIWIYTLIVIIIGIGFWIYNIIDAYREADRY